MATNPDHVQLSPELRQQIATLADSTGTPWDELISRALKAISARNAAAHDLQSKEATHDTLQDLLEPFAEALTPESAKQLAEFKASEKVHTRLDELSDRANEGELTEQELREYESYIRLGNTLSLIKAKAKKVLAESNG